MRKADHAGHQVGGELEPGSQFAIVTPQAEVDHPITGEPLGVYYAGLGTIRVLAAYETSSIAAITMSCEQIRMGDELVPMRADRIPATPAPPFTRLDVRENGNPTGYIVYIKDSVGVAAAGNVVHLDLGEEDGLAPGDYLTAFVMSRQPHEDFSLSYDYRWGNANYTTPKARGRDLNTYPPRIVGQMIVLSTESHTATAKIIRSLTEVSVGTMVEMH